MLKFGALLLWLCVLVNLLMPFPGIWQSLVHWLGIGLVVIHTAEYFIFAQKVQAKGDGALKSFVMTLIFGATYIFD